MLKLNNGDLFFYCTFKNKLEYEKFNYLLIVEKRNGGLDPGKLYDRPKQTLAFLILLILLTGFILYINRCFLTRLESTLKILFYWLP